MKIENNAALIGTCIAASAFENAWTHDTDWDAEFDGYEDVGLFATQMARHITGDTTIEVTEDDIRQWWEHRV